MDPGLSALFLCAGSVSSGVKGSVHSQEKRVEITAAVATSSAVPSAVDTVVSLPSGTGHDGSSRSVRASADAAALDAEREPLLKETGLMGSSHLAAGMPDEAAEAESGICNDPISQPDAAPSVTASAEQKDQGRKADAGEQLEPAQSSPPNMQRLLMGWQQAAGQPAAASKLDHVPIAASSEELHDQHQRSTGQSRQREVEVHALQAVQDLTTGSGPESQKYEAPGVDTSALDKISSSHAHVEADVQGASLVPSIPSLSLPEQLEGSVSITQEESKAALTQPASAAFDTNTESAGLAAEQFHPRSGSHSGQADLGMPKQAEGDAASRQDDQQASRNLGIAASAASAPEDVTESNAKGMSWSASPRKLDRPGRVFPLLDWALAENKVKAAPFCHAGHQSGFTAAMQFPHKFDQPLL